MDNLIEVRNSPIAGVGVFAIQNIQKGQPIWQMRGVEVTFDEAVELFKNGLEAASDPLGIDDNLYYDLNETSRSFNHSCDPNSYMGPENELIALREIAIGDEIFFDYSTTMYYDEAQFARSGVEMWTCPCACGTSICRGIIDQFSTLPLDRKVFYLQHQYMPAFMHRKFAALLTSPSVKAD